MCFVDRFPLDQRWKLRWRPPRAPMHLLRTWLSIPRGTIGGTHGSTNTHIGAGREIVASSTFEAEQVPPRRGSIRLGLVVGGAERLAVADDGRAALRPRVDVIGFARLPRTAAPDQEGCGLTATPSAGKHLAAGVKPENPPWVATSRPARATARDRCGEQEAKGEQSQESQKVRGNCGYQGAEDLLPIRRGRGRDDHDRKVAIASDVRFPREQLDS